MAPTPSPLAWPILSVLGKPITNEFLVEWFDGKPTKKDWVINKKRGLAVSLDHHQRITSIDLYSKGVEKSAISFGLPGGLTWASTRSDLRKQWGEPEITGEPSSGILGSEFAFDRWTFSDAGIWTEYLPNGALRRMQLLSPPDEKEMFWIDLDVFADYSQFYVADKEYTCDTSTIWDDPETTKRQLAVGDGLVAIGTKRYGTVPVTVSWHPREPKLETKGLDRVNECGLTLTTQLAIGNPISQPELTLMEGVQPGHYAVRILYSFQDQITSDETGNDRYTVQLWPVDSPQPVNYVKPR